MATLLKASGVKKHIKTLGLRLSKEAISQLERKLFLTLTTAVESAKNDKRGTVKAEDIV